MLKKLKFVLVLVALGIVGCDNVEQYPIQACETVGQAACQGDTRLVCQTGDGNQVWTPVADCINGCHNGQCINSLACQDQCPGEGLTGCLKDELLTCSMGDGCLVWAPVAKCSNGCESGACKRGPADNVDECPGIGVSGCKGNRRVVCQPGDGKYVWVTVAECSNGCNNGACVNSPSCQDKCPAEGTSGCLNDDAMTCAMGDGCLVWAKVATCSNGCQDGACIGKDFCVNTCPGVDQYQCNGSDVQICSIGANGCLEWTTSVRCKNGCSNGQCITSGQCVDKCNVEGQLGCKNNTSVKCSRVDGCLDWVDVQHCSEACIDGQCKGDCKPVCDGRECGSNNCGGTCGDCTGGQVCSDGLCKCPSGQVDCSGTCTTLGTNTNCSGCGDTCTNGKQCNSGECTCTPNVSKSCCSNNVCWVDSCGNQGAVANTCSYGCESCTCKQCTPQCAGRQCGSDGCGGTCGTCPSTQDCNTNGQCVNKTAAAVVQGKLTYDLRGAEASGSRIIIGASKVSQAALVEVYVTSSTGMVLAKGRTDGNGDFRIELSRTLTGAEKLTFAAAWGPEGTTKPYLAVLKPPANADVDSNLNTTVWSWTHSIPIDGKMGTVHVSEANGSGALYLLLFAAEAMNEAYRLLVGENPSKLVSLALLWAPGKSWSCGACYWGGGYQSPSGSAYAFSQSIYIGGESSSASAWGYPVILHEFGHYVAANYSKDDSPGGSHYLGEKIQPAFAWSEGWATFFAVSLVSLWMGEAYPLFWDINSGSSWWVDFDEMNSYVSGVPGRADINGSITQYLDELWVTTMLWHLWDGYDVPETNTHADDKTALGMVRVLSAISSDRFLTKNRGANGADFVDFADAVKCQDLSLASDMEWTIRRYLSFPYVHSSATCY